jgi:uncharacterized Zn finger protein
MLRCANCGGSLRRIHRTFWQRFKYQAYYRCKDCGAEEPHHRIYPYRYGEYARCPRCGTFRVTRLQERDRIDRFHSSLANFLARVRGGSIYHCKFCRLQFYDFRPKRDETARTVNGAAV